MLTIVAVLAGTAGCKKAPALGTEENPIIMSFVPSGDTEKVVILATTPDIPNDTVSFIKDLPADMRQKIVQALLDIAQTEEGKAALKTVYSIEGLQPAEDSFYDAFRADLSKAGINIEDLAK